MKNINWRTLILTVLVCLFPIVIGIILYNKFPSQIPIHYSFNNSPSQYAPKQFALFGLPVIMGVLQIICCVTTGITLKEKVQKPKIFYICEWLIPIITFTVYIIMIEAALSSKVFVGQSIGLVLGIIFIVIGNYMPKVSYENSGYIFHPKPKDEKTFRKYLRIMGYTFVIIGIIAIIISSVTFAIAI